MKYEDVQKVKNKIPARSGSYKRRIHERRCCKMWEFQESI